MSEESELLEWMALETFATKAEADALAALLADNAIEANVVNDANMGGDPLGLDFQNRGASSVIVRVHAKDIDTARRILEAGLKEAEATQEELGNAMFESFTDDDLLDVLKNQDEWNPENVAYARKLLEKHGKGYSDADLKRFFDERVESLRKPVEVKKSSRVLSVLGSLFALGVGSVNFPFAGNPRYLYVLLFAFLVSCLALIAGLNWTNRKKRLPNGEKIYVYRPELRRFAAVELILSAVSLALVVADIVIRTI